MMARRFHGDSLRLVGNTLALVDVRDQINRISRRTENHLTVLITGETGTGKDVVARLIHQTSVGAEGGAFVLVNCSAVARGLVERELFGHIQGAFTGAEKSRKGFFHQARRGTLFLNEIGHTSKAFQAKLLSVLEENMFYRVGSPHAEATDIKRFVFATNQNLERLATEGRFREDLYYRIAQHEIHLPPLRERIEDIPALIDYFNSPASSGSCLNFSREALRMLCEYPWPGNVRELKIVVKRCLTQKFSGEINTGDLIRIYPRLSFAPVQSHCGARLGEAPPVPCWQPLETLPAPDFVEKIKNCWSCDRFQFQRQRLLNGAAGDNIASFVLRNMPKLLEQHPGFIELESVNPGQITLEGIKEKAEKQYLQWLLRKPCMDRGKLADELRCTRRHVNRLLKKHGLTASD